MSFPLPPRAIPCTKTTPKEGLDGWASLSALGIEAAGEAVAEEEEDEVATTRKGEAMEEAEEVANDQQPTRIRQPLRQLALHTVVRRPKSQTWASCRFQKPRLE